MVESSTWEAPVLAAPSTPKLSEHVARELRAAIISGSIARDTHLVEARLSKAFDVSRGPIRDALSLLSTEGLVEARRRGIYVRGLSIDDIEELYSLRELIESEAVRRCLSVPTEQLSGLDVALAEMRAAKDADEFAQADLAFHSALYQIAGHRRLREIWLQYEPTFSGMLAVTNAQDVTLTATIEDHEILRDAIREKDESRAFSLLADHLEGSRRRMLAAYATDGAEGAEAADDEPARRATAQR